RAASIGPHRQQRCNASGLGPSTGRGCRNKETGARPRRGLLTGWRQLTSGSWLSVPFGAVVLGEQPPNEGQQILNHRGIEEVIDLLSLATRGDQICLTEHGEVVRHRRSAHVEVSRQVARRLLTAPQESKNLSTRRVGQRFESFIHVH